MRFVAASLLACLLPSLAIAETKELKPAEEADVLYSCNKHPSQVTVTFKPDTEVKELVTWVLGFTCKNFVYESRFLANKKVTIVAPSKLSPAEGYKLFLVALSTAGLTVVPKGNVYRIVENAAARRETVPIFKQGLPESTDQVVRYVYKPTYASAETIKQAVTTVKSDGGELTSVGAFLVITDFASNVRDMMSIAKLVDVPNGSEGVYTLPIKHADAGKLATKLEQFLGATSGPGRGPKAPEGDPTAVALVPSKIMVDERTNTLVVTASEAAYGRFKALVERLDIALEIEGGSTFHVVPLGSAIAEELAKTLTNAIQGAGETAAQKAPQPKTQVLEGMANSLEGPVRVISDKPTNSLIVMSSGRDFLAIKDVIRLLDQPRKQVFIEALVLEVQMTDGLDAGVSSHGGVGVGNSAIGFAGVQAPSLKSTNIESIATASGLVGGLVGSALANSEAILGTSIPSYGLLFQALATKSNTNVLSAPSIIAVDNEEAKYKVGTNIPYKKGLSIGGLTSSDALAGSVGTNIDRIDLQLELDIKPHISTNDDILLEVKHDSKDYAGKDPELGPTWNTRSFETRVLVHDQQTVVIGGLIQDREVVDESAVPILGDIPLLGYLFKYKSKSHRKTNLLILLTPHIVKDQVELQLLRERKVREHDEFIGSQRTLAAMKYLPKLDYTRKRGLLEEINRTVTDVEAIAAEYKAASRTVPGVAPGAVEQ